MKNRLLLDYSGYGYTNILSITIFFRKRKHEEENQPPRKKFKLESKTVAASVNNEDSTKENENHTNHELSPKIQEKRRQLALRSPFRDLLKKTLVKNHVRM